MKIIATLHNRRGDPLLLLNLLKALNQRRRIKSIGVAWSLPSYDTEPSWDELVREERHIQETLRSCVRMVHDSGLSWEAKSFLGRCYRSFQYEYMVSLNLKRRDKRLKMILFDDPAVRNIRYKEIGSPDELLKEIGTHPLQDQAMVLRSRYQAFKAAYNDPESYGEMVLRPKSVLLEISPEMSKFTVPREEYIAKVLSESKPEIILLRLLHCLTPFTLKKEGLVSHEGLIESLGLQEKTVMKLSEAERIIGPLPERD